MPTTKYKWKAELPDSALPRVFLTCLTTERSVTPRWWDGSQWWNIAELWNNSRSTRFTWPTAQTRADGIPYPKKWSRTRSILKLHRISNQSAVRYGVRYLHFSDTELIDHLIKTSRLNPHIRDIFQEELEELEAERKKRPKNLSRPT